MTAKRRTKVRYVVTGSDDSGWVIRHNVPGFKLLNGDCGYYTSTAAKRIAAALNVYEARRRGELT